MDLIQRKRILNMPRFNIGNNDGTIRPSYNYQLSYQSPYNYSLTQNSFSLNKPISLQDGKIGNTGTDNFKPIDNTGKIGRIINTKAIGNAMAIGKGALSIGQNMMSSLSVPGTSEIVNNAGQSDNSVMGVNYQEQNVVDGSQELKEYLVLLQEPKQAEFGAELSEELQDQALDYLDGQVVNLS